jgi:neutral ceramidase
MGFRAGFGSLPITPPVPGPMGGYVARDGPSEGVHDDLWARAIVLESDGVKAGLVFADILAAPRTLVQEVRREAAPLLGIREGHLIVAATHTHSGPAIPPFLPEADPSYLSWLAATMAKALAAAGETLSEARIAWGEAAAEGVGGNRRDPELPADATVRGLVVWGEDGSLQGILLNHACHPTVLGPPNRLISADFPGAALEALKESLGDRVWAAYAQGAAGDVSCRFTRRAQSFDEVRRLGTLVAEAGRLVFARAEAAGGDSLTVGSRSLTLPIRSFHPREETETLLQKARVRVDDLGRSETQPGQVRLAESLVEGYAAELQLAERRAHLESQAEVTAICIGDVALVAVPGELFTSVGRAIRDRSPFDRTMVVGYADGHVGYVPDRQAYAAGGYEALVTWLEPSAAELLVEAASGVLADLAEGRT